MQDAIGTAEAIRSGEISAREVVQAAIARIEQLNPCLNAVIGTRFEQALAEVDRGLPDGPLRGVPILIKALAADVAGLPATGGSRLFADDVKQHDSELVARYRRAGMVVLGTTNTAELGKNASTEPLLHGPTRNPWNEQRSAGGSSGGSAAAVAAGMVPVAHGNDGGGSIRIPAAMCGLFGLKPSRGRMPVAPYASLLANPTSVPHVLTTTVRDSALLLDLTAGPTHGAPFAAPTARDSYLDSTQADPGRLRIGIATNVPEGPDTDPECIGAVQRAADLLSDLGHQVSATTLRYRYGEMAAASGQVMGANLRATVDDRLADLGRALQEDDLEPATRVMYDHALPLSGADVVRALQTLERGGLEMGRMFEEFDVVLTPTLCRTTPELGLLDTTRPETVYQHASTVSGYTSLANCTGSPAMSVPFGTDSAGMPLGVQVIADLGAEGRLFGLATQLERSAPWPSRAPSY